MLITVFIHKRETWSKFNINPPTSTKYVFFMEFSDTLCIIFENLASKSFKCLSFLRQKYELMSFSDKSKIQLDRVQL